MKTRSLAPLLVRALVLAATTLMVLGCEEDGPSAGRTEPTDAASEADASGQQDASSIQDISDSDAAANAGDVRCMGRQELRITLGTGAAGVWGFREASDEELDAELLPNGCLPQDKVWNDCCIPAEGEAELRAGKCCYTFDNVSCC